LEVLDKIKDSTFSLAVGFYNPHIPYISPKRYWDLYDSLDVPLPENQFAPKGSPGWAIQNLNELYSYYNIPDPLTDEFKKELIRGYLVAISFIDAPVGLLINRLRKYNLLDNTIIVIWGDHGYQLGEHGMWSSKHTNYITSALSPLIISVPGMKAAEKQTASVTEFVDIYPSLADICWLPVPDHCQGKSFKPLLNDPSVVLKQEAYTQYDRGGYKGYSVCKGRYRLIRRTRNGETVF